MAGTSAHLYAVVQGLLKVMAGIEISFTLTAKAAADDNEDIYADLCVVKWSSLLIPPITIGMINTIAIAFAFARTVYSDNPRWGKFIGGGFFSFWVLAHLTRSRFDPLFSPPSFGSPLEGNSQKPMVSWGRPGGVDARPEHRRSSR